MFYLAQQLHHVISTDGEIILVSEWLFFLQTIFRAGLRRPKIFKFGIKVASSTRMMCQNREIHGTKSVHGMPKHFVQRMRAILHTRGWCAHLDIWEKFLVSKFAKNAFCKKKHSHCGATYTCDSPHATSDSAEHWGPCDNSRLTILVSLCKYIFMDKDSRKEIFILCE